MQRQMGVAEPRRGAGDRRRQVGAPCLPLVVASLALLAVAPAAQATFHLMSIREVYPGRRQRRSRATSSCRCTTAGQKIVSGHAVTLYNATGARSAPSPSAANLPGPTQQPADDPDRRQRRRSGLRGHTRPRRRRLQRPGHPAEPPAGPHRSTASPGATSPAPRLRPRPARPVDGVGDPRRHGDQTQDPGGTCTNLLDGADDTNNSASDFADATPAPREQRDRAEPTRPARRPPAAERDDRHQARKPDPGHQRHLHLPLEPRPAPASNAGSTPKRSTSCDFRDHQLRRAADRGQPHVSGAGHERQRNRDAGAATPGPSTKTRAHDERSPAQPVDPSPAQRASFSYSSTESGSKFECRLIAGRGQLHHLHHPAQDYYEPRRRRIHIRSAGERRGRQRQTAPDRLRMGSRQLPGRHDAARDDDRDQTSQPEQQLDRHLHLHLERARLDLRVQARRRCLRGLPARRDHLPGLGDGAHTFQVRAIDAESEQRRPQPGRLHLQRRVRRAVSLPDAAGDDRACDRPTTAPMVVARHRHTAPSPSPPHAHHRHHHQSPRRTAR